MTQNRQRRCRLAVLASHPIQYFTPLYKRLARRPDIDLMVMFYRDFGVRERYDKQFARTFAWDTDLIGGYPHRFLTNISPIRDTFNPWHAINPSVFPRLLRRYDAIWLNGYTYPTNWLAIAAASMRQTAVLMRSELRIQPTRTPRATDGVRDRVISWWIKHSDALLYVGEANREAYIKYGARDSQLFFSPYSVDVERIATARRDAVRNLAAHRAKWGIPGGRSVVLFAGKLTPRKHPEAALALAEAPLLREKIHLVFVGSGPMEAALRSHTESVSLRNVSFLGFVNQRQLPEVYACADIFVMPSEREPWGLALNEAMAAGAVPVVSNDVGASADLVRGRDSGFEVPVGDQESLERAVLRLVYDEDLRKRMSTSAAARAADYNFDESVRGIVSALRALQVLDTSCKT